MGDFSGTTTVAAGSEALFDHLAGLGDLPRYFARLTAAVAGDGEVLATRPPRRSGPQGRGDAWFRTVDPVARRIEWGGDGPADDHGVLHVSPRGPHAAAITVHVHSSRLDDGDPVAQHAITETLASLRQLVERPGAPT